MDIELQLGLALPVPSTSTGTSLVGKLGGIDLNHCAYPHHHHDSASFHGDEGGVSVIESPCSSDLHIHHDLRHVPYNHWQQGGGSVPAPARTLALLPQLEEDNYDYSYSSSTSRVSSESESNYDSQRYVKVTMEGVGIGRKVDLSLHHSFQTLRYTLMEMFGICYDESEDYRLTFQDAKGDWFLADHHAITWRAFTGSVQRLRILKIMF